MKKRLSESVSCLAVLMLIIFAAYAPLTAEAGVIKCDGLYGGHLQGVATDGESAIFWSFTVTLVKTNMNGGVYRSVPVPTHHGDLVYKDGVLYVAVNLGQFNKEAGSADSWVYVYDANDLSLISRHQVPEVVHGAGGMTMHDGHFFIVGGLPEGYNENYVYEYDGNFTFLKRHVIASGYTLMGIQTACYADGHFWFGCYGYPKNCALLRTDAQFGHPEYYSANMSVGIDVLPDGRFFKGATAKDETTGKYRGQVEDVTAAELLKEPFVKSE